ncbi:MAG: methionyl-tRNA formyltransferase [Elusimicrobia bacterium]|nr:methionyl-tRNA formyltransferase [Elusimicrobiota bacterium]
MKVVFYGTPQVAVPFLDDLASSQEVVGVVTQPDKPAGRGLSLEAPPVKARALALGLPVFQPARSADIAAQVSPLAPDLAVAVAFGRLLDREALAVPKLGTLNVHFSLLPKYRGAAPVQWSLVAGETKTGVTVFWLDSGLDTGPIAASRSVEIGPDDDAGALFEKLVPLGRALLAETLAEIAGGKVRREPQAGEPSLAPLIEREHARISLDRSASSIHNLARGMSLGPRAFMDLDLKGKLMRLTVCRTCVDAAAPEPGDPMRPSVGTIVAVERGRGFLIECAEGSRLWILSVQPEGKKQMPAVDFLNGARLRTGDVLRVR